MNVGPGPPDDTSACFSAAENEAPLPVTVYLAISLPAGTMPGGLCEIQQRLADAARKITRSGSPVRYLNGMYMPAQNRLLCVFAADSEAAAEATVELVRLPYERINAVTGPAPAEGPEPGG